ncbi:hypothetical protein K2Z83_04610 [Oscillochloris sp. ZM17-4]|uniref:hypothetical protein n=1 Tax=Oscillochloris sp. ZM17-4 TaxID=2866714 RepID=UPI001C7310EB|nr:hypothetical protein [Oscillochloris sp. ZM17-4]MBX0326963.1 hypothetical protein [Oscillochloris sp. ZM17-4]
MTPLIIAGVIVIGALLALPTVRYWGQSASAALTGTLRALLATLRTLNAMPLHEWDDEYVAAGFFVGVLVFIVVFWSWMNESMRSDFLQDLARFTGGER